jgi:hypothetical protein
MQLYGAYRVSKAFGWHVIHDKRVNANMQIELSSPIRNGIAPKLETNQNEMSDTDFGTVSFAQQQI